MSTCAIFQDSVVCAVKYGGRCQVGVSYSSAICTAAESSFPTGVEIPKSRAGISYNFW